MFICPSCFAENRPLAKFCRKCGTRLPVPQQEQEQLSVECTPHTEPVSTDIVALDDIRKRLQMFIKTLVIRTKRKTAGLGLSEGTSVLVFRGETGTGKSLVAEWFIGELVKSGALVSNVVERSTAHKFQRLYRTDSEISKYLSEKNLGVLLIDEIHDDPLYLHELLLGLTEKQSETVCILIGIQEPLEKFFAEKNELADLVNFYDFPNPNDENLVKILDKKLCDSNFIFSDEVRWSFLQCIQEAKHNPSTVHKNAWLVEKEIIRKIMENQAFRLSGKHVLTSDDLKTITIEDMPVTKKCDSVADVLSELDSLVGMESVKTSIRNIAQTVQNNLLRKEKGLSTENPNGHIVLTGNPGTGKTTVSRILGKLFFAMTLLPSDKVIETSGLDLTAGYVGQTKDKVNEICDKAMGGVLFIDEAYYLAGKEGEANSFAGEAVGTLLKRMEDDRGKFIIIAAGYQDEMNRFLKLNPGLESRFEYKIHIEDYTADELFAILQMNLKKSGFFFSDKDGAEETAWHAVERLCKNKEKNFANGRAVRNLFDEIKLRMDSRIALLPQEDLTEKNLMTIRASDIPQENNKTLSIEEVFAELDELIGMEKVKQTVHELYNTIKINKELERLGQQPKNPEIHIVLTGNPGTGKTTVARILGKVFFAAGLLSSNKVVECDRSKIVGKYMGHTARNMQSLCDDAMGGILFIDEVYTLATDDFGHEATDTLMKRMEDDRGKFVVIVAGYKNKMREWMASNEGLSSRFTHYIHIDDYNTTELYELFCLYAKKENLILDENAKTVAKNLIEKIWKNNTGNFANGRTVRKIFDNVVRNKNSRVIVLPESERTKTVLTTITSEDFLIDEGAICL